MSDSPFGDRNRPRTFDPEQSNGENAPANRGGVRGHQVGRITKPDTMDEPEAN